MRPEYNGVKYYSPNDLGIAGELEKAANIIQSFDPEAAITDINAILELFNVQKLLECETRLKKWSDDEYYQYQRKAKSIKGVLGRFFTRIDDSLFIEHYKNVAIEYIDDFWELFENYKCYRKVSPETFDEFLLLRETPLYRLLSHKEIVRAYDTQLTKELRTSDQTCQILVSKFLEETNSMYYLPPSFDPREFEAIFQKYIDSDKPNPNKLHLVYNAQSTKECPISPKLKLNAKRKYDEFWNTPQKNEMKTSYGIGITIADQNEDVKVDMEGTNIHFSYDRKWLEENLGYSTILNNLTYIFGMFDHCYRSTLVSVKSKISAMEGAFAIKGKKYYPKGIYFNGMTMMSYAKMDAYYRFLQEHDVNIEDIFKWFFETYLSEEFGISGFCMKASSATDYVEKCRNLAAEMDGILKQYRMFVRDGYIDRELFEMESEHLIIDGMQSLIKDKYGYSNGVNIQNEMFLLFSDQSLLGYIERTESEYPTLFELLRNERCPISDIANHQLEQINWLIGRGAIIQTADNNLELNYPRVAILKDLYDHDVICIQYLTNFSDSLNEMIKNGDIRIEDTLFSKPEKEYLNYVLNKAEYSNGLDLRNKYAHSTYPQNEEEQRRDYIELLKIMILVITKMNEEFCWIDDRKRGVNA